MGSLRLGDIDVILAASGYEPRCTHVLDTLQRTWKVDRKEIAEKLLVLEFVEYRDADTRTAADRFFDEFEPGTRIRVTRDSPIGISAEIGTLFRERGRTINVLVDYTAMARLHYLTLIPSLLTRTDIHVNFAYAVGDYSGLEDQYPVSTVGKPTAVPGLEGIPFSGRGRLYLFGLGYDGVGAEALAERLEADHLAVFWADPGASSRAADIAQSKNARLIDRARLKFSCGLREVEKLTSLLTRLAYETAGSERLVFIPIGPKPHILACGLAASQFEHAALLAPHFDDGGILQNIPKIQAAGEIICTSVRRIELPSYLDWSPRG